MTALERNCVDDPDIALIAERIDHVIGDAAMLTDTVNCLLLCLTGDCLAELIAAIQPALESFCRSGSNRLGDRLVVKVVFTGLGEKEDMLVTTSATVFDTLRHGIFLHPDDVVSQIPSGIAEGKRQHPRNTDHVLRLAALNFVVESHSLTVSPFGILGVNEVSLIAFSCVGIGDVEPECPIGTQNAPDFCKYFRQTRDIFFRCSLSADLVIHSVITQRVVRRGCYAAVDALIRQRPQNFETVTGVDVIKLYSGLPPSLKIFGELNQRNTRKALPFRPDGQ